MECLDEVNFNLVPRDRASTAALGIEDRCDNCRNILHHGRLPVLDARDNSNHPTITTSTGITSDRDHNQSSVSRRSVGCSCPSITFPSSKNSYSEGNRTPTTPTPSTPIGSPGHCQLELSPPSSLRLMSSSPSSLKSSASSSSLLTPITPSSSTTSTTPSTTTMKSFADDDHLHPPTCLSFSQPRQIPTPTRFGQSPMTDSVQSLEGLSLSPLDSASTTTVSGNFRHPHPRSHSHDFSGIDQSSSHYHFNRRDSNPTEDFNYTTNTTPVLIPPETPYHHSPPHNQSQPIPIQQSNKGDANSRHTRRHHHQHHHNDTDLTEGRSLTPSSNFDRCHDDDHRPSSSWGEMPSDHHRLSSRTSSSNNYTTYNPFASSPAERLSVHFYSQQSPKYFKLPSASSSSCSPKTTSSFQYGGCSDRGPDYNNKIIQSSSASEKPTVFDRWPIGLSCNSNSSRKPTYHRSSQSGGWSSSGEFRFSRPSSVPKTIGNSPLRNEAYHHHPRHHHNPHAINNHRWRPPPPPHHHHHRHQSSSAWRSSSRWEPMEDGSSGEDDVTMTPVDDDPPPMPTTFDPYDPYYVSHPAITATKAAVVKAATTAAAEASHAEEFMCTLERRLPQGLLFQLHDLEHRNEDLSADVVFALESKGFAIHDVLGKGISSTVRRVTEKATGTEYAVKIIDISGEKGDCDVVEQTKKDTMREIKILRMCGSHKNIIHLHDVFETPTFIFLVFELCRQGELFDYLTSVVSLSEKRTRVIMRQLLDAVQYIHERRIVHRDLKPENILMDDDLNIKVSDFGFATTVDTGEELGELCGTPGYLAPEVLAHSMYENVSGYGKEVDMWACGVIMYTLLCGAPPFWNRRQMLMLRAIMNADYTFNTPEWDDISDAPKNLIQGLLVVNPKDRLTARECLAHPFFKSQVQETTKFKARRKFRGAVFCIMFYKRLARFYKHPPPISVETVCSNPYSIKLIRKAIDTCAFSMYRHWVKRVDNQNRAALFEHTLRDEWKHNSVLAATNTTKHST